MTTARAPRSTAGGLHAAMRGASLRARVLVAATLLVAMTCLVTGVVGTALLRGYLLGRSDAQLRDFAHIAARIARQARACRRRRLSGGRRCPRSSS